MAAPASKGPGRRAAACAMASASSALAPSLAAGELSSGILSLSLSAPPLSKPSSAPPARPAGLTRARQGGWEVAAAMPPPSSLRRGLAAPLRRASRPALKLRGRRGPRRGWAPAGFARPANVEAVVARDDGGTDAEVEWRESWMGMRARATSAVRVPPVPPLTVGDPEPSPSIRNEIKDASAAPFPVY